MKYRLASLAALLLVTGCVGSQMTLIEKTAKTSAPVKSIAMASEVSLLATAVAIEFADQGYAVVESGKKTADASLSVKTTMGKDNRPETVAARLLANDGKVLAGVNWQNAKGGAEGSYADRSMKKGISAAAKEIAGALIQELQPETKNTTHTHTSSTASH